MSLIRTVKSRDGKDFILIPNVTQNNLPFCVEVGDINSIGCLENIQKNKKRFQKEFLDDLPKETTHIFAIYLLESDNQVMFYIDGKYYFDFLKVYFPEIDVEIFEKIKELENPDYGVKSLSFVELKDRK